MMEDDHRTCGTKIRKVFGVVRRRCTMAAFKRYLRIVRYRLKVQLLFLSTVYLSRHWFDFFCHPWTFDDILFTRRLSLLPSLLIFGCAIAWAWKHQTAAVFWRVCAAVILAPGMEIYFHYITKQNGATTPTLAATSICVCAYMVAIAVFGHVKFEPKDLDTTSESRVRRYVEADCPYKDEHGHGEQFESLEGQAQTTLQSNSRVLLSRLPSLRDALAMSLLASLVTVKLHPPLLTAEILSPLNCKAHVTQLDYDGQHFEFTTTDQNNTLTGRCTAPQQVWALAGIMNTHVNDSSATCGVWCMRLDESGKWFGYISQVESGLVDVYYCRGQYGSFGPDCEAEGEDYGYDTSREEWMNDIYEPWSVLEAEDPVEPADVVDGTSHVEKSFVDL